MLRGPVPSPPIGSQPNSQAVARSGGKTSRFKPIEFYCATRGVRRRVTGGNAADSESAIVGFPGAGAAGGKPALRQKVRDWFTHSLFLWGFSMVHDPLAGYALTAIIPQRMVLEPQKERQESVSVHAKGHQVIAGRGPVSPKNRLGSKPTEAPSGGVPVLALGRMPTGGRYSK